MTAGLAVRPEPDGRGRGSRRADVQIGLVGEGVARRRADVATVGLARPTAIELFRPLFLDAEARDLRYESNAGSSMTIVAPGAEAPSTRMVPPWRTTMSLAMARPRPAPPVDVPR